MSHKSIIRSKSEILHPHLLRTEILKIHEYLTHRILKSTIKAALLLVAAHQDLIQLYEEIFIVLAI
jgi:hypothetical protein